MKKKTLAKILLLALTLSLMTACGSTGETTNGSTNETGNVSTNETTNASTAESITGNTDTQEETTASAYIIPTVDNGQITINTDTLTEHPLYINYDSNGTTIQLLAVNASDGSARLSLNTCQACNPSPRAYFKEVNGRLVCQNCGNVFTMDSVGETAGGCNPMNIAYNVEGSALTVSTADLDKYAENFAYWNGTTQ